MVQIEKFCKCGAILQTTASDEDVARQKVSLFRRQHAGLEGEIEHGPVTRKEHAVITRKLRKEAEKFPLFARI